MGKGDAFWAKALVATGEDLCPRCGRGWLETQIGTHTCQCGAQYFVAGNEFGTSTRFRGSVLIEAHKTINGARQDVYGSPEDSFKLIAGYWNQYLVSVADKVDGKHAITAKDVAMMMTLFKIAREANQHKRDNCVDAVGYLGIYADMQEGAK